MFYSSAMSKKMERIINYFGGRPQLAKALGVTQQAVFRWVHTGVIPPAKAIMIERITGGRFKAVDLAE